MNGRCILCHGSYADCDGTGQDKCTKCSLNAELTNTTTGRDVQLHARLLFRDEEPTALRALLLRPKLQRLSRTSKDHYLTYKKGLELVNGICHEVECHPNCVTCSGPEAAQCKS